MTGNLTAFLYNDDFMKYYFGPSHPFQPGRVKKTKELLEQSGVLQGAAFLQRTKDATVNDLRLVHTQRHIDFVHSSSMRGFGLLDQGDTPATPGIYEGSLAVVGATLEGVEGIMQGRFNHAFNPAGGLASCESRPVRWLLRLQRRRHRHARSATQAWHQAGRHDRHRRASRGRNAKRVQQREDADDLHAPLQHGLLSRDWLRR